jgi:hypothetical protein
MATSGAIADAEILAEVIAAHQPELTPEAARLIVDLHFTEPQNVRMRELADKNNRGLLTEAEQAEMESYRRAGHFLALLQAKARLSLKGRPDRAR